MPPACRTLPPHDPPDTQRKEHLWPSSFSFRTRLSPGETIPTEYTCEGDDPHRYFFRLYALDTALDLDQGATKEQLTDAMDGHILDQTDLIGTYQR